MADETDTPKIRFDENEIATLRKFFAWVEARGSLSGWRVGLTGMSDEGITVSEWVSDYEGGTDEETTLIPLLAMTDPEEHERQLKVAREERERQQEQAKAEEARRKDQEERDLYQRLQRKYAGTRFDHSGGIPR